MQQQQGILKSSRERDNETLEAVKQSWQETNEKRVKYIYSTPQATKDKATTTQSASTKCKNMQMVWKKFIPPSIMSDCD